MVKYTNFTDAIDDGNIPGCDFLEHVHHQREDKILFSCYNFSIYLLRKKNVSFTNDILMRTA